MHEVHVTIIGKPECHLCDIAAGVIDQVLAELPAGSPSVTVRKLSILDDPKLHESYWEQIPVVLINGEEHAHWRVESDRLRAAILDATR